MVTKFTQLDSYNQLLSMCRWYTVWSSFRAHIDEVQSTPTSVYVYTHHFLLLSPLLNCISLEDILVCQISWFCWLLTLNTCSCHVLNGSIYMYHSTDKVLMFRLKATFSTRHRAVEGKVEYEVFLCGCEACIPAPSISTPISEARVLILASCHSSRRLQFAILLV